MSDWGLLSNHGRVLVHVAREPEARLRDIGEAVGTTERTAHRLVSELVGAGYVTRARRGSRNSYIVNFAEPVRDPLLGEHLVGELIGNVVARGGLHPDQTDGARTGDHANGNDAQDISGT